MCGKTGYVRGGVKIMNGRKTEMTGQAPKAFGNPGKWKVCGFQHGHYHDGVLFEDVQSWRRPDRVGVSKRWGRFHCGNRSVCTLDEKQASNEIGT